jgi:hypothetical protein
MGRPALSTAAWQRQRLRILERDGRRCRWCGGPADEVDHIIPADHGGTDADDNLAASCRRCNRSKGARTPSEWSREPMPATVYKKRRRRPKPTIIGERDYRHPFAYHRCRRDDDEHVALIGYMTIGTTTLDTCPADCPRGVRDWG